VAPAAFAVATQVVLQGVRRPFLGIAIALLEQADHLVDLAVEQAPIIVGELAPPHFQVATDSSPFALHDCLVHGVCSFPVTNNLLFQFSVSICCVA
jgi:hypothetical protein